MGARLFVGNLPYSATEEEVRGLFAEKWGVVEVRIVTDRESGRSRGFGFVELDSEEAAKEATTQLDGAEFAGRRLAIREAHERGGGPRGPRRRPDDRSPVSVESAPRRGGGFPRPGGPPRAPGGPPRTGGPPLGGSGGGGRRFESRGPARNSEPWPPPEQNEYDDGGKNRRRERRKKKKERHEPDNDW